MPDKSDRSNIDLCHHYGWLHLCGVDAVHIVGRLGLSDRVIFLLRHAVDDRFRRHRAGYRNERVVVRREVGYLCAVAGVRTLSARYVLQPDAGGGQGQVRVVRTETRTSQKRRRH